MALLFVGLSCGGGAEVSSPLLSDLSEPLVRSQTGVLEHGAAVSLIGGGFGTKSVAFPHRWDDFDSGAPGALLKDEASGGWYLYASQPGKEPRYSNARSRWPGSQSAYQDFTGGNYNSTIALTNLPAGPIYMSGWFYLTTWGAPSRNVKLLQMRAGELHEAGWECRIDQYPSISAGHQYVGDCTGDPLADDWDIAANMWEDSWHRIESWLDQGTAEAGNGVWTVWIDGQPWTGLSGTFMTRNCPFRRFYIGHYFAEDEGSPMPEAERYWDELYVDFTRARVELGDAPTWASCTHREVQIPKSWSPTSITITVNQGAFAQGQTAYLYVVNGSGVANANGLRVVVGVNPDDPELEH
jgi:hypothetical protein